MHLATNIVTNDSVSEVVPSKTKVAMNMTDAMRMVLFRPNLARGTLAISPPTRAPRGAKLAERDLIVSKGFF